MVFDRSEKCNSFEFLMKFVSNFNYSTQQNSISIYFEEQQFDGKKRMEKYIFIDFLAGGLLGLFLDISPLNMKPLRKCNYSFGLKTNMHKYTFSNTQNI